MCTATQWRAEEKGEMGRCPVQSKFNENNRSSKAGGHPKSEITKIKMLQLDDFPIVTLLTHAARI